MASPGRTCIFFRLALQALRRPTHASLAHDGGRGRRRRSGSSAGRAAPGPGLAAGPPGDVPARVGGRLGALPGRRQRVRRVGRAGCPHASPRASSAIVAAADHRGQRLHEGARPGLHWARPPPLADRTAARPPASTDRPPRSCRPAVQAFLEQPDATRLLCFLEGKDLVVVSRRWLCGWCDGHVGAGRPTDRRRCSTHLPRCSFLHADGCAAGQAQAQDGLLPQAGARAPGQGRHRQAGGWVPEGRPRCAASAVPPAAAACHPHPCTP